MAAVKTSQQLMAEQIDDFFHGKSFAELIQEREALCPDIPTPEAAVSVQDE